jgi:uncharacterized protein Usg
MKECGVLAQLDGYGLTRAEIHFYHPDAPSILQFFILQGYDLAPDFPVLIDFLDYWRREIEGTLHSVWILMTV